MKNFVFPLFFLIVSSSLAGWLPEARGHFPDFQLPRGHGDIQRLSSFKYPRSEDEESSSQGMTTTMVPPEISTVAEDIGGLLEIENSEDGSIEPQPSIQDDQSKDSKKNPNNNRPPVIQHLWRVYNFSELINSDQELIFSPRFYLSEPGYRLQLMITTNTTYSDMTSYLGVFFRIVAGDYDGELEWPYRHETILSVLRHEELNDWTIGTRSPSIIRTRFNHTVTPNLDECRLRSAFLRPNSDVDTNQNADGCGNRRHMPLSALESDRYLKDDTLLVLISVRLDSRSDEKTFPKAEFSMRFNELVSNFLWPIERFSEKQNESMTTGKIVIVNSEPFYTHPNGYLIQLYLTILPKRSAFAVSLTFVQGDYDRHLQWPFPYPFEMAIVDQSPDYWKRDVTVKVQPSKSDCGSEPFSTPGQQPEFCFLTIQSLQVLQLTHYNFLLNDTLKIRFTTRFERYSARQRASILFRNNRLVSEFNWIIPGLIARFQRYLNEQQSNPTTANLGMLRKTHRFVSDEFYTNGQGYLCQLILTVAVRNVPTSSSNDISENSTESSEISNGSIGSQDILVFSLELVILEGEFDRFMEWPFNNAFELAIVGYKSSSTSEPDSGSQFYFEKHPSTTFKRTNSQLIIPSEKIENGQCSKQSFWRPIKQNPPCGIKEFATIDIGSGNPKKSAKDIGTVGGFLSEIGSLSKTDDDLRLRVRIYL